MSLRVWLGWDAREQEAFRVAERTARRFGCEVIPLYEERLRMLGLLTRTVDRRSGTFDFVSNAPQSTDFANARFFVPLLGHSGWCLFADSDVVFMLDPHTLKRYEDPTKAVCVVKHPPMTVGGTKMDGQVQTSYPRKLWSSVAYYNCDHPSNQRLNLTMLNQWPGRDLHAFKWLDDDEIGDLPPEANWLVGMQPKPENPIIAHFTMGTPDMPGLSDCAYSEIWYEARQQ